MCAGSRLAFVAWVSVAAATVPVAVPSPLPAALPARPDSVKFAAIGDTGTGDPAAVRRRRSR